LHSLKWHPHDNERYAIITNDHASSEEVIHYIASKMGRHNQRLPTVSSDYPRVGERYWHE
jgi:hypothetical protein